MLLAIFAAVSANAQVTVGDFTYNFYTNNGQAYVDAYTGTDTEITIPGTITYDKDGTETTTEVRGISATAFQGNTTIEKIHIDDVIKLCERNIGNKYLTPNKNTKIEVNKGKIIISKM